MIRTAVYPGSFNPWHKGHSNILSKALHTFDKVIVAVGMNPDKNDRDMNVELLKKDFSNSRGDLSPQVEIVNFNGLLVDFVRNQNAHAVIRGLRNANDLQYEMNQQYWNEDLGLTCPVVYFVCDRTLSHISSSAIRALNIIKKNSR